MGALRCVTLNDRNGMHTQRLNISAHETSASCCHSMSKLEQLKLLKPSQQMVICTWCSDSERSKQCCI